MNKFKCNCNSPHCKECENRRIVETGVKTVIEANEHSVDLRTKASDYKIGDIVPYKNTRSNIKLAKIVSLEIVENGKAWFHGIDTETKAKVWYPVHISEKITKHQFKVGDHIDYLIGNEWQRDYATIHGFDRNSNLPIAETNHPGHDGCKWSYTFDLSTIRLTQ